MASGRRSAYEWVFVLLLLFGIYFLLRASKRASKKQRDDEQCVRSFSPPFFRLSFSFLLYRRRRKKHKQRSFLL